MEINYIPVGNYFLPAIKLSDPPDASPLGLYGELHKRYLREHRSILYSKLLLSEKLYSICREIDEAAQSRRNCPRTGLRSGLYCFIWVSVTIDAHILFLTRGTFYAIMCRK